MPLKVLRSICNLSDTELWSYSPGAALSHQVNITCDRYEEPLPTGMGGGGRDGSHFSRKICETRIFKSSTFSVSLLFYFVSFLEDGP